MQIARTWGVVVVVAIVAAGEAAGQATSRVSVATGGGQANHDTVNAWISADGRYVAFPSLASNLVPGDANSRMDVFVRDRQTGTTELVSIGPGGVQGNDGSFDASISADGRYVAFSSSATNLVPGDTNTHNDVFVRDRLAGTTERVSLDSSGLQGNSHSSAASISADGRYVSFQSLASNLVAGDSNATLDVFVRDRQNGTTVRVSVDSSGAEGNSASCFQAISADGQHVAFASLASNLVPGDSNAARDVFVHDLQTGTTERVSVGAGGSQGNGESGLPAPAISGDGRFVAFMSNASNLVSGDVNGAQADVFVRDRQSGTTELVDVSSSGVQGDTTGGLISISADGLHVVFSSTSGNLTGGDTNGTADAFVRDRQGGVTERVSLDSAGAQGNQASYGQSISADGRVVVFVSLSNNFVSGDTNNVFDVFVRDRDYVAFASTCHPGTGGVIACPCSNPPGAIGQGCDNSAGTGGAILAASGIAYLSADTLVFTTSGEKPTALSIVMQGTASLSAGAVYGQGVRCVAGTLKRLYTKAASAGSITAPDFGAGDPSVSVRSAANGNVIAAGQSRWYLVYYRDPIVLGGCPAGSTFNATQSGQVEWLP